MIDATQVRAARAMLQWNTSELAEKTGLTMNALNKIERGLALGRRDSIEKIQKVFENEGLEFLPGSGVRKKDRIITAFEGEEAQQMLLNDVYQTLAPTGGEVLIAHVDEGLAIKNLPQDFLTMHVERLNAAKITERMLIRAGDKTLVTQIESYRMIPEEFFVPTPMFVYGEKLALLSWQPSPRAVVINDARFAESARRLFNFIWEYAQKLPPSMRSA